MAGTSEVTHDDLRRAVLHLVNAVNLMQRIVDRSLMYAELAQSPGPPRERRFDVDYHEIRATQEELKAAVDLLVKD